MALLTDIFYIDNTGIHVPDLQTVMDFMVDNYKDVYGKDVVLTPDTQDGQWVALQAQALHDTMEVCGKVYRSFSPATALSDALDTNVRINGIRRNKATYSMCDVKLIGTAGTEIINGSVKDINNQVWNLPAEVIIPVNGEITVTATAANTGSVTALPNTINNINTPTRGWQSVNNENEAFIGSPIETDAELRQRQGISTALPSQTILEGMIGAIAGISGVTRYKGYENDDNVPDDNGIPAHSSCMVVEGGDVVCVRYDVERADRAIESESMALGAGGRVVDNLGQMSVLEPIGPELLQFVLPRDLLAGDLIVSRLKGDECA